MFFKGKQEQFISMHGSVHINICLKVLSAQNICDSQLLLLPCEALTLTPLTLKWASPLRIL